MVADDLVDNEMEDLAMEEGTIDVCPVIELSLNSVVGLTTPGAFKVKGMVEDRKIIIMVDCLLKACQKSSTSLLWWKQPTMGLSWVQGRGMCKDVMVGPNDDHRGSFLPLELHNLDMVLGMQWLGKQGAMTVNWR